MAQNLILNKEDAKRINEKIVEKSISRKNKDLKKGLRLLAHQYAMGIEPEKVFKRFTEDYPSLSEMGKKIFKSISKGCRL